MNKKNFIDNLYTKRSNYNDPEQAETAAYLLDTVSHDIYSESQRFIFELIQNADDAAVENSLKADNIIIACCNHDTLHYLQQEGDGAFLSRIEDRGEIVQLESAVIAPDK